MATETRTFATFANDNAVGATSWSNVGNAQVSDDARATATALGTNGISNYHKSTNSSHLSGSTLTSSCTINSIKYRLEKRKSGNPAANCRDYRVMEIQGGVIITANNYADVASDYGTSDAVVEYTQTTNLPTAATILDSGWGVAFACQNTNSTSGASGELDYTEVVIDFTPPASPVEEYDSNVVNPKFLWEYKKLRPDYDEHACPGIMIGIPIMRQGATLPPIALQFSYSMQVPILSLQNRLIPLAPGSGISWTINIPRLSLPMRLPIPALAYNTVIRVPVLRMVSRAIPAYPIYNYQCILPILSSVTRVKPLLPAFSFVLNIPSLKIQMRSLAPTPAIITPSLALYVESQRSSAAQVIYGSSPGPFKLNKTAGPWRHSGRVHIVHTGKVKPKVCTVEAQFTLATAFPNLEAGEFLYERYDGYLTITNLDPVSDALIPDGDTFAIDTTPEDAPLAPMLITIDQPPTTLP